MTGQAADVLNEPEATLAIDLSHGRT
jgi:hypothetical protein